MPNTNLIMILFGIIVLAGIGLFMYVALTSRKKTTLDREEFRKRWQTIEQIKTQGQSGLTLAIIEADKLLDQALKQAGHPGATMGDRLKGARNTFRSTDDIWQAHKLRNRIAHETDINLNQFAVDRALGQFKAGLRDLGAL